MSSAKKEDCRQLFLRCDKSSTKEVDIKSTIICESIVINMNPHIGRAILKSKYAGMLSTEDITSCMGYDLLIAIIRKIHGNMDIAHVYRTHTATLCLMICRFPLTVAEIRFHDFF